MFSLYFKNRSLNGFACAFFPLSSDLCAVRFSDLTTRACGTPPGGLTCSRKLSELGAWGGDRAIGKTRGNVTIQRITFAFRRPLPSIFSLVTNHQSPVTFPTLPS